MSAGTRTSPGPIVCSVNSLVLGVFVAFLTGCRDQHGGNSATLTGAGSTFVEPMMGKWAEVYKNEKNVHINYQGLGSGAGIKQMTDKAVDFGCTDAFMKEEQLQDARKAGGDVVHIPLVMGGVVPAYNVPGVDRPVRFTGGVLADIFLGRIHKWNDKALQSLQEQGVELPDLDVATVHRSDSSGTTSIFTDYLSKASQDWREGPKSGTSVKWPLGGGENGTAGVAGFISKTPGSIGYVELIYALQNKIQYGAVKNRAGKYVLATLESVTKAAEGALKNVPDDLRYSITDAPGEDAYPISGTTWAVVYVKQPADRGPAVADFLRWVTHEGQKYTSDLQYAPLPEGLVRRVDQKLGQIQVGQ